MKCDQCHKVIEPNQGKEKEMKYKEHTVTIKMCITQPSGVQLMFDIPVEPYEVEAREKIDELLSVKKCYQCKSVIEPDALYIEAGLSLKIFCTIKCYCAVPALSGERPAIKRLEK